MPAPLTLLHLIGRALLDGLNEGDRLAGAVWQAWCSVRNEPARQAEWLAVGGASTEELRRSLVQVVLDLTADGPAEARQGLANVLAEAARGLRRAAAAPAGPAELRALLPGPLPGLAGPVEPAIVLRVTAGPHAGQVFRFTGHDTFLVGRSRQAHFNLGPDDRYFSRVHFLVEANPPQARLMDMGSHNGTHLNGTRVTAPAVLAEGDRIQAGHTVLTVSLPGSLALLPQPVSLLGQAPTVPPLPPTIAWAPAASQAPCKLCNPGNGKTDLPICPACRARLEAQPPLVPGYRSVRELGRGGMGVVSLALCEADGSVVAVKTIAPALAGNPDQVERFLREARVLEALDHPNIVAFREMGEADGLLYFVMDYVAGGDAAALLRQEGPLPAQRAVGLIGQVLQALDYAHARRFVHRDIKPANILVSGPAGSERACLADFGLARVYQASQLSGLTVTGAVGGTPAFMAPEQVTSYRDASPPADQYAAAATLYHLLTGAFTHDFAASTHERLLQLLHDDPVPIQQRRPDLGDDLAGAIHRALAREPRRRFGDARSFRRALLAAV